MDQHKLRLLNKSQDQEMGRTLKNAGANWQPSQLKSSHCRGIPSLTRSIGFLRYVTPTLMAPPNAISHIWLHLILILSRGPIDRQLKNLCSLGGEDYSDGRVQWYVG